MICTCSGNRAASTSSATTWIASLCRGRETSNKTVESSWDRTLYCGTTLYKTCADATLLPTRMWVGVGITSAEAALRVTSYPGEYGLHRIWFQWQCRRHEFFRITIV
jgi:hypothetical protein